MATMAISRTSNRRGFCWSMVIRSLMPGRLVTACVLDVSVGDVCVARAWLMVRPMLATLLNPPPVAVTVNVNEPVSMFVGSVTVNVEAKLGVPMAMLKAPFAPDGNPDTDNETCELNPFNATTLTEYETVCPCRAL